MITKGNTESKQFIDLVSESYPPLPEPEETHPPPHRVRPALHVTDEVPVRVEAPVRKPEVVHEELNLSQNRWRGQWESSLQRRMAAI